ncbi:hypothetical protein ABZ616_14035 [Streptomyces noursei]|uniref:Uncharacterized protein n=1 Tax=Streptomyces mashuensis TaxID=33904 RepID=A0A919EF25_9ACTN|nr:hypothetical protein [Streptomyces mashuensis]GHF61514.1 hypothetical protein GCM10010218_48820 [Streptomyces mashuensis]
MSETYTYHWAVLEWPDDDNQPLIQVVKSTRGPEAAKNMAWGWARKHLSPGMVGVNVRYLGRSDTRTRY